MPAFLSRLDPAPHPADTSWVDRALTAGHVDRASAVVVTRPLGSGPAVAVTVHDQLPDTGTDGLEACPRAVVLHGTAAGPARFATVVEFYGPRSEERVAAEVRAGHDRIHPATWDVPGYVGSVHVSREDGGLVVVSLAESAEALQEAMERIMATDLLEGEDPSLLPGPDRTSFSVVVRAELPAPTCAPGEWPALTP